ncbi:AAA family ATPase [Streptomyces sp. NPDC059590]|uniref:AAA family ATPase n=1 Tax=Streptomyces sp. NPDC059590 TaxID=3346877 RepID=UPI00368D4AA3
MDNVRRFNPRDMADDDALNSAPPHDGEAEDLVTGAIMHSAQAYAECAEVIDRDDIYRPANRLIWDVVGGLVAKGDQLHPVLVRAEIEKLGRLREVDNGYLIDRLGADYLPAPMAAKFAERIYETARQRRFDEHSTALKAAVLRKADSSELAEMVAAFQQAETLRESTGHGPAHLVGALLDWDDFFATDFGAVQLLLGKLMGPGQQITVVGDGKAGKSLFVQEWMWRMATGQGFLGDKATAPVRILYLDAENGQEQVQERFLSFGGGHGRMGELRYASFPPVRPLDTAGGGADLLALVKHTGAELVVIDTVSRFISGPENDADTWLSLYRHTLLPLKRERVGSIRLDHFGKDKERGGRGSSAKTQDVDHVWELSAQGGGSLTLKRTHTRTGIGPDYFALLRRARRDGDNWLPGGTRHVLAAPDPDGVPSGTGLAAIPGTVEHLVAALDRAGLPNDAGNPRTIAALTDLKIPASKQKIAEAVRLRKNRGNLGSPETFPRTFPEAPPRDSPGDSPDIHRGKANPQVKHSPGTSGEPGGTPTFPPFPPSKEGEGGEGTAETSGESRLCDVCERPLNPDWAARGYTTHLGCDPATGSHPNAPGSTTTHA